MDILNDFRFSINKNYNFWKYKEVLELNLDTVQKGLQWTVSGDEMKLSPSIDQRRKSISVCCAFSRFGAPSIVPSSIVKVIPFPITSVFK